MNTLKKIFLSHKNDLTRAAVFEGGELEYFYTSGLENPNLIGNVYKGTVKSILPGLSAAFVDIGRAENVFLRLHSDEKISIGQSVLLQIEKNSTDFKAPRAGLKINLPARHIVLMPETKYIGISGKLSPEEKSRLYKVAKKICPPGTGIIMRTAAADCPEEILSAEVECLQRLWETLKERFSKRKPPALIYDDNDLAVKIIREELSEDTEIFLIDNVKIFNRAVEIAEKFYPEFVDKIKHYKDLPPLFEKFGIEKELAATKNREVALPSGGFIIIDKTEALTVIDVNSGKFFDEDKEETIFKTNMEAAKMILRQIQLRDIGGIIIVDFADMIDPERQNFLLEFLREGARKDRSKLKIVDITKLGLVEMTRKKRDAGG